MKYYDKLVAQRASEIISKDGYLENAKRLRDKKVFNQYIEDAKNWVDTSIEEVKSVTDDPHKTDEEICEAILRQLEKSSSSSSGSSRRTT